MKKEGLKRTIINAFNNEYERRCISLLSDAYISVQSDKCIDITCNEEYISVVLFDYIDKFQQLTEWHISIAPEYIKYKNMILKGKKSKTVIPKINMKFGNWTNKTNLDYSVDIHNIIEIVPLKNKKSGFQNPIIISESHVCYIAKVDNCLSNTYPVRGCMVCNILQGNAKYTVNCLNHHLCDCNRAPEILKKYHNHLAQFDACYVSTHKNGSIQHLIFDFSNNKKTKEKNRNETEI
jgi:hypothetical protein